MFPTMEPMTLGSPHSPTPGSPMGGHPGAQGQPGAHPGYGGHGHPHAPFLPGYLMGDNAHVSPSMGGHQQPYGQQTPTGRGLLSPHKLNRSLSTQYQQQQHTSTPTTPGAAMSVNFGGSPPNAGLLRSSVVASPKPATPGGPPTQGLLSRTAAGTPRAGPADVASPFLTPKPVSSVPQNVIREEIFNNSNLTPNNCDSGLWVTVFGFPPSSAGFVLSQFSQCGTVLRHFLPPNGNWMHIKFQTKLQAQKAIGRSDRVLGGSIMIGVSACSDQNIMREDAMEQSQLNQSSVLDQSAAMAAAPHFADTSVTTLNSSLGGSKLNSSIRPLTQAYKAANNEHDISFRTNTPNRQSGIVSKAMECIFGW